jgi:hypothetical protein
MVRTPRSTEANSQEELLRRLDKIIRLLQDLIILEGIKMNANKDALRKHLEIDKRRVNRISKLLSKA